MPDYSQYTDEELLSIAGWKEGRGEVPKYGDTPVLAMMHTLANRVMDWGWSLQHVILAPNQISSMSVPSDPEFNLIPDKTDPTYIHCLSLASAILNHTDPDETCRAHFYAVIPNIQKGGWFDRHIVSCPALHPVTAKFGSTTFFR
jgi:hypothetical protein